MGLKTGTFLGQYEILSLLGVGGMGEVYQARDSKLNREVALKVLPEQFVRDPERIGRFRREAQVLAALDHPNIARIYAFEESGSARFLVMELALGETLRERIPREKSRRQEVKKSEETPDDPQIAQIAQNEKVQVPRRPSTSLRTPRDDTRGGWGAGGGMALEEALEIAKQIAAALEAAHEKAIVHRDLKPANVKVTPEGVVKVLDFGLAKAFAGDAGSGDHHAGADSPTLSAMTTPGTILGTAAYMSPEQARGRKVDKRTDIWALGCVLYEMLTGKHAFDGDDVPEILASVMKGEPDWMALPATTPPGIRNLLRKCLQKDAAKRFHSAADIALEMEEALREPEGAAAATAMSVPGPVVTPLPAWRRALPLALALAVGAMIAGLAVWNLRTPPLQPVTRTVIALPPGDRLAVTGLQSVAISPDGTHMAYVAQRGGEAHQIYLRAMDSLEARPLLGTEGADNPFFSPDGQWVGFFAEGKLKKTAISGGAVLTLCDASAPRGASWGSNDRIVFAPTAASPLFQVSAAGGTPEPLTKLDESKGETSHRWPQFLPDGKAVLFTTNLTAAGGTAGRAASIAGAAIGVQRLDTGERKVLVQAATFPRYVPTGHLVYYQAGNMMAVPFDLERLEVTGTPAPIVEGVMGGTLFVSAAHFGFSNNGALVYVSGGMQAARRTLVWVDRKGVTQPINAPPHGYETPRLSSDGQHLALAVREGQSDIRTYELTRGTLTRLTFDPGEVETPLWMPDGKRVAFAGDRNGVRKLLSKPADGSGVEEELLATRGGHRHSTSWSPDGQLLAFEEIASGTSSDIWVLPLKGERKPSFFLRTPFLELQAAFSPDGHWLAYRSNESGRDEVYVQAYPGPGGKWQISTEGGTEPVWARNGRELFYRVGDKMMAVEIRTQPAFSAGTSHLLFEGPYLGLPWAPNYDVSPDGQRFLMIKPSEEQQVATQINVVLNWFEELRRRVPAAR